MSISHTAPAARLPSAGGAVLRIVAIFTAAELAIMAVLETLEDTWLHAFEAAIDATLLIAFAAPLIYRWVVRPFAQAHQQAVARIAHLAYHDELTALPNRRQLHDLITQRLAESARHREATALLFIDLDGFKQVNDTHGHDAGDALLQQVAQRLRAQVRHEDAVSRIGGDEFVVFLARLPNEHARAVQAAQATAAKIASAIREPVDFHGKPLCVGASIGIRVSLAASADTETLLREADQAMYRAKLATVDKIRLHGHDAAANALP